MVLEFVPLAFALVVGAFFALNSVSRWVSRLTTRTALALFADEPGTRDPDARILQAAHIATPYRIYVARTRLYAVVGGIVGAVIGVYGGAAFITFVPVESWAAGGLPAELGFLRPLAVLLPETDTSGVGDVSAIATFVVLVLSSIVFGFIGSSVMYALRRTLPRSRAEARERDIEANMPRMVAFVYALSRGGMSFPEVLRALAENEGVFGEASAEAAIAVRNVDLFGRDIVTALRQLSERTPSDQFRTFTENLTSILQSGQDLPEFLAGQYDRYRAEAEEQQAEIIEQLATTAEVYVTVVVAGMLFLITILLIIGLTTGDTLFFMQLSTYMILPALNLLFIAYLLEITSPLRARRDQVDTDPGPAVGDGPAAATRTDGGFVRGDDAMVRANLVRLGAYRRIDRFRSMLRRPFRALLDRPYRILYITLPIAAGYVAYTLIPELIVLGRFDPAVADDPILGALIFALGTYAIVHERSKKRLDRIEAALPDLLDRLASLNEAGVTVVKSFGRVRESDIGAMGPELERIWRDIQWGATVEEALDRFERRVRTPAITRLVTLINSSMTASNDIGPVLRIAGEQARRNRRFKRARQQEMFTYLVAIYVAFLVFIIVIVAIDAFFIPRILEASAGAGAGAGDDLGGVGPSASFVTSSPEVIAQYRVVFFHAALLQGLLSGLVGGQMGEGSIRDGVKHATIMLVITYVVFELVRYVI